MNCYICIHGHFYQPPRENPWLEEVEVQDSAYPYHDWNERITAECYAPNMASRILDVKKKIINIVNNYAKISFNFGPTLLAWLEKHQPEVYKVIIEADRISQQRFSGHGGAIAQPYNHIIMPLARSRDKYTQIIWGIKDFEYRFRRRPEGMWLPETAVDFETLDILAEQGIGFTILAPRQAKGVRKKGEKDWKDVSSGKIDPRMPYLCQLPSGKTIAIFFYEGSISHEVAFGELLNNGEVFAKRLIAAFREDRDYLQLVHIATDGESYGHHHRFGDMALAYALYYIESNNLAKVTNYGEYLENFPPTYEVDIFENSSWSCAHGVERWRNDCGCHSGMHPGWNQKWRAPLRQAMDWLRDKVALLYEREIVSYVEKPWQTMDNYIEVILDRSIKNVESFFSKHANRALSKKEKIKVLKLLEMQRYAMLMHTSCGWFFDEISGIETVQVMGYASRTIQLAKEAGGKDLEANYLKILEQASSNILDFKNGAYIYDKFVKPAAVDLFKVSAHYALSSLFEQYPENVKIFCYTVKSEICDLNEVGIQKLAIGNISIQFDITWDEKSISFAVLYLGNHNLIAGISDYKEDSFSIMSQQIKDGFMKGNIAEVIRLMDNYFGTHQYSIWHLFKDKQREVLNKIIEPVLKEISDNFRQIYDRHYPLMQVIKELRIPLPKVFSNPVELVINIDLSKVLKHDEVDLKQLEEIIKEAQKWSINIDIATISFVACKKIESLLERFSNDPKDIFLLETIENLLKKLSYLPLKLNLWRSQNFYFSIGKQVYKDMREKAKKDEIAQKWISSFDNLGNYLQVKII